MFNNKRDFQPINWMLLKSFLAVLIPLAVLLGAITSGFYYINSLKERRSAELIELHNMDILKRTISNDLRLLVSDLMVLSEQQGLKRILEEKNADVLRDINKDYLAFSKKKGLYDQIRFIDEQGAEVTRVNFNNGRPEIVPEDKLQNKRNRYYFKETLQLGKGEIFVSPFDLNIENGAIEQPLKPMIRLGTPIFDSKNKIRGALVFNYFGAYLLNNFKRTSENFVGKSMLINNEGFWMYGMRPEDEWGFMFEDRKDRTFQKAFPDAWLRISTEDSGQFYNKKGMFTFGTLNPLLETQRFSLGVTKDVDLNLFNNKANTMNWKIVTHLTPGIMNAGLNKLLVKHVVLYGILCLLLAIGSWFLAGANVSRKKAEEALEHYVKELERSNNELKQFANVASHDLQEPLRMVSSFTQLLAKRYKGKLDSDADEFIAYAVDGAKRMQALINDLLDYSRVRIEGKDLEPIDVNIIFEQALANLKISIEENDAIVNTDDTFPIVMAYGLQLTRLFQNLISNAIKYRSERSPEINVGVKLNGKEWLFYVKDNGIGIEPDHKDSVFNIFRRLHSKEKYSGTGIGLAICKKIAEGHNGRIWVESAYGEGSTFYFTIPIVAEGRN